MKNIETMSKKNNVVRGQFERSFIARMIDQIKVWNQQRLAIRQLNLLSDRMLSDIGIDRYDISETVRKSGSFSDFVAQKAHLSNVSAEIRRAA